MGGIIGGKGGTKSSAAPPTPASAAAPTKPTPAATSTRDERVDTNKRTAVGSVQAQARDSLLRDPKQGESIINGRPTGFRGPARNTLIG